MLFIYFNYAQKTEFLFLEKNLDQAENIERKC